MHMMGEVHGSIYHGHIAWATDYERSKDARSFQEPVASYIGESNNRSRWNQVLWAEKCYRTTPSCACAPQPIFSRLDALNVTQSQIYWQNSWLVSHFQSTFADFRCTNQPQKMTFCQIFIKNTARPLVKKSTIHPTFGSEKNSNITKCKFLWLLKSNFIFHSSLEKL
jgi:hypothetical protein